MRRIRKSGCDAIKGIIVIVSILLVGLVSAYTPEQQTTLDGMNLSYKLGIAYVKASQGQNVAEFNVLVDTYNEWISEHFGENANLFKPKINETMPLAKSLETNETTSLAAPPGTNDTKTLVRSPETTDTKTSEVSVERKAPVYLFEGELAKFGRKQITDMA